MAPDASTIPLHSLGVVDVAANEVKENDILAHALANVSRAAKVEGWAVRRSSDFVNEYPRRDSEGSLSDGSCENPNHLLGSFPCLFPYGRGGFEVDRPRSVTYEAHARWALRYEDKRFRKDLHFIFQIFGVLQKRQLCAAAALQISKRTFLRHEAEIRSLKSSDFDSAALEERSHTMFSNPIMRSLRQNLSTVRAKVMGTDESRIKVRSLIWGMSVKKNPPSIWLTINPADTQDPVAQVLCGEDINLDNFDAIDRRPSSAAIAADPYASATFFHLTINAVLQALLGITGYKSTHPIKRERGVLGEIDAYIGTVEAQGRGTLHLHMVLWLKGSLTSSQMKDHLKREDFRTKLKNFISANIRADLPNVDGPDVLSIPRASAVAFARPVDPRLPNYERARLNAWARIARTVQVHQCSQSCMRFIKTHWRCKRRAPFPLAAEAWIDEEGQWGPRRTYGYLNNFCPSILQCLRANHDIKLISNSAETKAIAFYITNYLAKKQKDTTNSSAVLGKTFAFNRQDRDRSTELSSINKKLLQRCANTLSRQQELSAPEVISYLMGWGDRYISHHFETIHWYSVVNLLKSAYPLLKKERSARHSMDGKIAVEHNISH